MVDCNLWPEGPSKLSRLSKATIWGAQKWNSCGLILYFLPSFSTKVSLSPLFLSSIMSLCTCPGAGRGSGGRTRVSPRTKNSWATGHENTNSTIECWVFSSKSDSKKSHYLLSRPARGYYSLCGESMGWVLCCRSFQAWSVWGRKESKLTSIRTVSE